ncbi:hypothetical protein H6758_04285 [Candidatus Nomurabacteria bacterium]|nr:hypothetical protein [Candidatus Nomurabacteria bacterium]
MSINFKDKRIIIGILLGLILVLVFFVIFGADDSGEDEIVGEEVTGGEQYTPEGDRIETVPRFYLPVERTTSTPLSPSEMVAKNIAVTFVERFESRSSLNDNSHIEDAKKLASGNLLNWLETQRTSREGEYAGVTARVVTAEVEEFNQQSAKVVVYLQKQYADGKVEYGSGTVNLASAGSNWKVTAWFWQPGQ